jgi:hypothetical protein
MMKFLKAVMDTSTSRSRELTARRREQTGTAR